MCSLTFPSLKYPLCKTTTTLCIAQNHTTLKWQILHNSKTSLTHRVALPSTSKQHSLSLSLSSDSVTTIEASDKKDKVITFFETHGFSKAQISEILRKIPQLHACNLDKILLPKFEFFYSKGFTKVQLVNIINRGPIVLIRSLKKHIVPSYDYLNSFIGCNVKTNAAIRRGPFLIYNFRGVLKVIVILQEYGMSQSGISMLLVYCPVVFRFAPDVIRRDLERIKQLGLDPKDQRFVIAFRAITGMNKSSWNRKVNVYKRWGWCEEDVLDAFKRCPWCMAISEDKIMAAMEYFTEHLGYKPSNLFSNPSLLTLSLDKRVKPRIAVVRLLLSKRLIKKKPGWGALLKYSEKIFLKKFIQCYEKEAPELLKLYRGDSDFSSLQ